MRGGERALDDVEAGAGAVRAVGVVLLERGEVRGVLPARGPAGAGEYRLTLLSGSEHVAAVFPGAVADEGGAFRITVADAHELSARVAALLARGAVIVAVMSLSMVVLTVRPWLARLM